MTKTKKILFAVKNMVLAAVMLFALTQCAEQEIVPANKPAAEKNISTAAEQPNVASVTISGVHTVMSENNCTTCTYVVPANTPVIDGRRLDIKPGSVICLDKAIQYGMLEFINFEGTEGSPITIGYFEK